MEFRLLYTLMIHHGQVLSTEVLVEHVWGYTGGRSRYGAGIGPSPSGKSGA
jgi:DNA-binding response OmpR family regulator